MRRGREARFGGRRRPSEPSRATSYAAILREIQKKGGGARFRKVERGEFELAR